MSYLSEVLADTPLAYWRLDDAVGATSFADASGNGRHMPIIKDITLGQAPLIPPAGGQSASFNGTSSEARMPWGAWMNTATLTVEAWILISASTNHRMILTREINPGTRRDWDFRINSSNQVEFTRHLTAAGASSSVAVTGPDNLADGRKHHVAATYDGTTCRIYIDGALVTTSAIAGGLYQPPDTTPLSIGITYSSSNGAPTYPFAGSLDEVAFYGSALSDARIRAHYLEGDPYPTGALLYDRFNRPNSTTSLGAPDIGGPYTVRSGTWGISNGDAYLSAPATDSMVTFPASVDLDLSMRAPSSWSGTSNPGLMFRWVDINNFWVLATMGGNQNIGLYRRRAGTYVAVTPEFPVKAFDRVRILAYGPFIWLFVNDNCYGVIEDVHHSIAAPVAGLRNGGSSTGRWDDVLVKQATAGPVDWDGDPAEPWDVQSIPSNNYLIPHLYKGRDTATADESEIP